ncbi:unnamed protein product (macronuclear) [Paramecium tetraurelia]|uniref:Gustatory receptor n=1 Tax=Paramecium tetraurelia TaxID=5888 RepID=A0DMQ3_PARTE|nr:uncharacterized protein GSPATT00018524001 [Paramecium tetraurelia]CAK84320.1 unnamed protein product [Paramecium tetraurelia]|eukprot:XP_001451717.1 hypothetical protein (macronuclear) [Paramecium tetraurelia strain d4-2]
MSDEQVANELDDLEKNQVKVKFPKISLISLIQDKIVSVNHMSQSEFEDKHETNLGITPGRSERESFCKSKNGSSLFFREDLGRSRNSDFDPTSIKYRTQPHEVHFRIKIFIKYLTLRILFSIFGPLMLVYGLIDKGWINFMGNFRIYGWSKPTAFNYFCWVSNYAFFFSFAYYVGNYGFRMMHYEIVFFGILFITENVTYAIKFSFFHPTKLSLVERFDLNVIRDLCEQSLSPYHWIQQLPSIINREFEQSIKRNQIEPTSFLVYFMIAPSQEKLKRIQVEYRDNKLKHYEEVAASCISMAKEIVEEFNKKCHINFINKFSIFVALVRVAAYVLIMNFCNESVKDYGIAVQMCIFQFMYFYMITGLMMITYRDLRRKVFAMTQLSHLISAEKVEVYQESKMFPTLNLLCCVSLYSWVNLRKMILDYGLQYTMRQSFMLSFIMILNAIMMAVMTFLFYLGAITINSILQQTFDFVIIASISIALVLQGARINAHWSIHRGLLRKNLFLIQQLAFQIFKSLDYTFKPEDPVFTAFQKLLETASVQSALQDDQFLNYSMFCIRSIQNVYDDLGHQEKSQPYTVMGIAMTYQLLLQVCISALGLIGTSGLNFILQVSS